MNCLLYARVSTDKQAQKELSIPAQVSAMREHARRNGWKVVGHFVDQGESARTINRPELKRLITYCKEQKGVDLVLVHKIDRLARNLIDYATIKTILKQKGIRLVSVSEPFGDNSMGHLLENIMASISEWYSANLGDEIRKANAAKLANGEWPHKPPLGYKSVRGVSNRVAHVPDEATGPLIVQAYELFATGRYSLKGLSEELFARGLVTRSRRMYSEENIKRILSREFYMGQILWQDKVYVGKHPPLVPKELFYRVQDVLKRRSTDTGEKGRRQFLMRGIASCGVCGHRLTGEVHARGSYYRCVPRLDQVRCSQPYSPAKSLDEQLARLYEQLRLPPNFVKLLQDELRVLVSQRKREAERQLGGLKQTLAEVEQKEVRLLDELLAGTVDRDIYEKVARAYRDKRHQAERRLVSLEVDYGDALDFLERCAKFAGLLAELHRQFGFEQRKDLARSVFARIDVQDRAIAKVQFNPPFSFFFDDLVPDLLQTPDGPRPTREGGAANHQSDAAGGVRHVAPIGLSHQKPLEQQLEHLGSFMVTNDHQVLDHLIQQSEKLRATDASA